MKLKKPLQLDGRTGEGGGQLVRIACALAAVRSQPIRIYHVRANREGKRGGGLKAQHVAAIQWLVENTGAEVDGIAVGSHTFEFRPSLPPTALQQRKFDITAGSSASSIMLIFQAVLPYLLFAGNENGDPIELEINGGTNCSFSLSYEYLDQVLLPTLQDKFGIHVERQLKKRSWTMGPVKQGSVWLRIHPLPPGQSLKLQQPWDRPITTEDFKLKQIDVSMLVPHALKEHLERALVSDLGRLLPGVDVNFLLFEDSGHETRMYTLLVAHSETGLRWGRDYLYDKSRKNKGPETLSSEISRKVCKDLFEEISVRGVVDEYLQDQLVVFQALADGRTSFHRGAKPAGIDTDGGVADDLDGSNAPPDRPRPERSMRKDKTDKPFGEGSTHTTTARWVASELLPTVQWFDKGSVCDGTGISFPPDT
ncbi:EPT/RTPC-like protein [Hypoxylon rubiginosum]|uniref:EPT/RTPC-like protein n=1 Tax=Hypoxylon rubiginosum TaxID=110542 RepID=A0ACB9YQE4_9PEZI|nr:EPT/RTPC-like protein [Hypoxylon rubiginosum]